MTINLKSVVLYGWLSALTLAVGALHVRAPEPAPAPAPAPAPDDIEAQAATGAIAVGKSYAPSLVASYASGWDAAANALESGASVLDSQRALQDTFLKARQQAFALKMTPALNRILPEGSEPADPAMRKAVAGYWRNIARGLRNAK